MKIITVLGSTGTIGKNTLDVIRKNKNLFKVFALTANSNIDELKKQAEEFKPSVIVLSDKDAYEKAKVIFKDVKVLSGTEGLCEVSAHKEVDFVMAGIVGAAGLLPFIAGLEAGKTIGLANKEVMVTAGEFLHAEYGHDFLKQVIPVDSEHSAIFQCLHGENTRDIEEIIITASGGPFRTRKSLKDVTVSEALKHPNWSMGSKITIDSATMMNKGLEFIEAYWLFPVKINQIKVVVHPQSIIHSMVAFNDGSIMAHMGIADMRIPIQYALSYPGRIANILPRIDFSAMKEISFEDPDEIKFPCLNLAKLAVQKGGFYPAVLNAANEIAVEAFLQEKISFIEIAELNQHVFNNVKGSAKLSIDEIIRMDNKAREEARKWISCNL